MLNVIGSNYQTYGFTDGDKFVTEGGELVIYAGDKRIAAFSCGNWISVIELAPESA